jgi:RNA polymerase sigma factor (sigma-70 family)
VTLLPELTRARPELHARFEAIVRQYERLIGHVVLRIAGRHADMVKDDVRQNVLIALWKQIEREQEIEQVASYIYKATVREAVRARRRETERRERQEAAPPPLKLAGEDPHRALDAREQALQLEACLAELSVERQQAVRAHLAGFEVAELMANYGWSYQKARNLVARGMQDLRDALRQKGFRG